MSECGIPTSYTFSEIGKKLRAKRGSKTTRELAKELKCSAATISRIENGSHPRMTNYFKILNYIRHGGDPMSNWDIEITIKGTISDFCFADNVEVVHKNIQEQFDVEGVLQTFAGYVDLDTIKLVEYQLKKKEEA